jgi:hypothetical protein
MKVAEYLANREAEVERKMNEQTDEAESAFRSGELIGRELFLLLCNRYNVELARQKIGMMRKRIEGVARDRFTWRQKAGKRKPDVTGLLYALRKLLKAIEI